MSNLALLNVVVLSQAAVLRCVPAPLCHMQSGLADLALGKLAVPSGAACNYAKKSNPTSGGGAFFWYQHDVEVRKQLKLACQEEGTPANATNISKMGKLAWGKLSAAAQQPYVQMAKDEQTRRKGVAGELPSCDSCQPTKLLWRRRW